MLSKYKTDKLSEFDSIGRSHIVSLQNILATIIIDGKRACTIIIKLWIRGDNYVIAIIHSAVMRQ